MSTALLLARRYLLGRRLRTALTTLAVVFGVMIMFGMQGVIPAVRASFDANLAVAAHGVDLIVTRPDGALFPQAVAEDIGATPGVALVMPVLERPLRLSAALALPAAQGSQPIRALTVNGVDPAAAAAAIPIAPVAGRWFGPGEERAALVRETLLEQTGLALGDTLRIPTVDGAVELTIVGVLPPRPVFGDEELYLPLATAQAVFGLPGQINALVGQFAEGQDDAALREAILAELGAEYAAGVVEAGGAEWDAVLRIGEAAFLLFGGLALAMGGFSILNTFRTGVAERRRDIGMLRAVGASRRTVMAMVVAESLVIGVVGTLLGVLAGYALVSGLLLAVGPAWEGAFGAPLGAPRFGPAAWAISVALGLGVPLLSGLLPALAAGRLTPLEALRPADEHAAKAGGRGRLFSGGALLGLALLGLVSGEPRLSLLGALLSLAGLIVLAPLLVAPLAHYGGRLLALAFPREGGIAQGNLLRNPGRAAVTASAMLISLAILVALAGLSTTFTRGLLGYLEQSIRADYMLAPEALVLGQGNVGAGPELARRLRETPGIAAVTTLRQTRGQLGEVEAQLVGVDPATYPELAGLVFTEGEAETAYGQLAQGGAVIVNGVLAAQLGVGPGDTVTLQTLAGPRPYAVAGVGIDYLNSRVATAYLGQAELDRALGPQRDALLLADRDPGADVAALEAALLDLTRDYPAFSLVSFAQWREEQVAGNQTRTNILYVLMAVLAVPSLIALVNTLGINVLERTRELGVLRAIGATRGQVQRIIVAESLLLAALGVLGGAVAGVGLGYALVGAINRGGLSFPYVFPAGGIALACGVGLLFGVLAALLPARRAARLDIVAALRWE
jgi:putative ABC transport system permease protein